MKSDFEIIDVLYSDEFAETKTRYYKKQLSKVESGKYLVEVYDIPFYLEVSNNYEPYKLFDDESEALEFYNKITSISKARALFK